MLQKWLAFGCQEKECRANYRRGTGPQGACDCCLSNAVPGYGKGGCSGKRAGKIKCSTGGAPGNFKIFPRNAPPRNYASYTQKMTQLRCGAMSYLPSTVNIDRGAASRTGQVPDLSGPPTIKSDTFEDILTNVDVLVTPQRWVLFTSMATSMPIVLGRPSDYHAEWTHRYKPYGHLFLNKA